MKLKSDSINGRPRPVEFKRLSCSSRNVVMKMCAEGGRAATSGVRDDQCLKTLNYSFWFVGRIPCGRARERFPSSCDHNK